EGDDERSSAQDARVYVVPMTNEKPVSTPNGSSVSSTLYDKAERKVPPTPEEGDKKPPFKVVVSPFGEDPRPKPVGGYYDDVTEDFTFSDRSVASAEPISPEEKPAMKDLPEFDDGMRIRHTEVRTFEKTEPNIRESFYDETAGKGGEPVFEESFNSYDNNAKFDSEFYNDDDSSDNSFDDGGIDRQPAAKTNVPRPRETTFSERPRVAPAQQSLFIGKTQQKFTDPEDDDSESIENMPANYGYVRPPLSLLNEYKQDEQEAWEEHNRQKWCAEMIVKVIKNKKNIDVRVENIITGPSITRYDISIPEDVSPSDVFSARQDLSFRLETGGELRMYNIPYTSLIGIEVANKHSRTVGLKEAISAESYQRALTKKGLHFVFGEDLLGQTISMNVNAMPHLLVCGTTGSGKSVCLNTMLVSLLYHYSPAEFRLIIIDPKKVEFKNFKGIPHLVFNEILGLDNRAIAVLEWAVAEMDRRYEFLADLGYKDIFEYNRAIDGTGEKKIPSILILIDEFAELVMAQAQNKKKIEQYIGRLAQKARSAGISLICATQRASVNVITGSIKANIASRICFKTSSPIDSRVIIDEQGADKLLGNGDALYKTTEDSVLHRGQGAFISNDEIKKVVAFINEHNKCYYDKELLKALNAAANSEEEEQSGQKAAVKGGSTRPDEVDEDYKKALRFAISRQVVSGSSLRTVLKIGYNKSAAIIMWMEKMGYISPILENRMRKVIFTKEDYENTYGPFEDDDF
ncbi:MAG: DNA translocase FtsK, partial [Clostridia bacterium]|nr:DNA translocase FtsK [Clostridia bacterium]